MNITPSAPTQTPGEAPQLLKRSVLAVCLTVFSIINFICAAFGVLLIFTSITPAGDRLGWNLLFFGLSGGLVALALAKIIRCLHDLVRGQEHLKKLLEDR